MGRETKKGGKNLLVGHPNSSEPSEHSWVELHLALTGKQVSDGTQKIWLAVQDPGVPTDK